MQNTNKPSRKYVKEQYEWWFRTAGIKMHPTGGNIISICDLEYKDGEPHKKVLVSFDVKKDMVVYLSRQAVNTFYVSSNNA